MLDLSVKEFALLHALLRAGPAFLSSSELLDRVWDEHADPFTNTVAVTMGRLRRKLVEGGDPALVGVDFLPPGSVEGERSRATLARGPGCISAPARRRRAARSSCGARSPCYPVMRCKPDCRLIVRSQSPDGNQRRMNGSACATAPTW